MARQLAEFEVIKLMHEHILNIMGIAAEFDTYVKKVQDISDEERMLELGVAAP